MRGLLLCSALWASGAALASAVDLPSWVDSITITAPDAAGIGALSLSGIWLDTCVPDTLSHTVVDQVIDVTAEHPGINVGCGDALTPWSLHETFGPLAAGTYELVLSLFAVDPANPEVRELVEGPTFLALVPQPCYLGDLTGDGQVDGLDIGPFIQQVVRTAGHLAADVNQDGAVDGLDVRPLIDLLLTDGLPVPCRREGAMCAHFASDRPIPELSSVWLAVLGFAGLLAEARQLV